MPSSLRARTSRRPDLPPLAPAVSTRKRPGGGRGTIRGPCAPNARLHPQPPTTLCDNLRLRPQARALLPRVLRGGRRFPTSRRKATAPYGHRQRSHARSRHRRHHRGLRLLQIGARRARRLIDARRKLAARWNSHGCDGRVPGLSGRAQRAADFFIGLPGALGAHRAGGQAGVTARPPQSLSEVSDGDGREPKAEDSAHLPAP